MIVGLGFERLGQQPYVALELVDPVGAARVVLVPDPAQFPDISGHIDIFVGDAFVAGARVAADEARIPVAETASRPLEQPIPRRLEPSPEVEVLDDELHIRIGEEQVVVRQRRGIGMVERGVARLFDILKREAVQFPGETARGEERDDEVLGAVRGSGIADDPARDVIGKCAETAFEVRHLVLHDHVEAERSAVGRRHYSGRVLGSPRATVDRRRKPVRAISGHGAA